MLSFSKDIELNSFNNSFPEFITDLISSVSKYNNNDFFRFDFSLSCLKYIFSLLKISFNKYLKPHCTLIEQMIEKLNILICIHNC